MPSSDEQPDLTPDEGEPEAPAAAPSFVTVDEWKASQAEMQQTLQAIREGLNAVASRPMAAPAPPSPASTPPAISEEQFQEALATGDAKLVSRYLNQTIETREAHLRKTEIEPLKHQGMASLADLTRNLAAKDLKYYQKYQKEIDAKLANIPPEMRLNPEVYRMAHDSVVGANVDALVEERLQERLRKPATPEPMPGGGTAGRRAADGHVPTVEELFGREAVDALNMQGEGRGDPDRVARGLGFNDWADYVKRAVNEEAPAKPTGRTRS